MSSVACLSIRLALLVIATCLYNDRLLLGLKEVPSARQSQKTVIKSLVRGETSGLGHANFLDAAKIHSLRGTSCTLPTHLRQ